MLRLDRPVGIPRDIAELEYVLALLQCTDLQRLHPTLSASDVEWYLRSRHGLQFPTTNGNDHNNNNNTRNNGNDDADKRRNYSADDSNEQVRKLIVEQLCGGCYVDGDGGGGGADVRQSRFDLAQLTAVLLIPTLLEEAAAAAAEDGSGRPSRAFAALEEMLQFSASAASSPLTLRERIQTAFRDVGEGDFFSTLDSDVRSSSDGVGGDSLLDEMVQSSANLTEALTGDVRLYNLDWHSRDSIIWDDVNNLPVSKKGKALVPKDNRSSMLTRLTSMRSAFAASGENSSSRVLLSSTIGEGNNITADDRTITNGHEDVGSSMLPRLERISITLPSIDYAADTFRRPFFVMVLWAGGIAAHFAYVLSIEGDWLRADCAGSVSGCAIANGIVRWLAVFFQLVLLGVPFIVLGSLGNSVYVQDSTWRTVVALSLGISVIALFTVVPFFMVSLCWLALSMPKTE
jgi:hypothetical protein